MDLLNDKEKKALVRIVFRDNDQNEDVEMGFGAKLKETKDDPAPVLLTCSGVLPKDTKQHADNFFVDGYLPKSKLSIFPKSKKNNHLKKMTDIIHHETMDISNALYEGGNLDRSFLYYTSLSEEQKKKIKKLSAYVFEEQEIIELQFVNQGGTYTLSNILSKQGFDEARAKGAPVIYQSGQGRNNVVGVLGSNDNPKGNPILSPIFLQGSMFKVPDARPNASVCDNATGPGPTCSRNQDTDESAAKSSGADAGDSQSNKQNKQQSDDRGAPGNSGDVVQVGTNSQTNNGNSANTDGQLQQINNYYVTITEKAQVITIGERSTVQMNIKNNQSVTNKEGTEDAENNDQSAAHDDVGDRTDDSHRSDQSAAHDDVGDQTDYSHGSDQTAEYDDVGGQTDDSRCPDDVIQGIIADIDGRDIETVDCKLFAKAFAKQLHLDSTSVETPSPIIMKDCQNFCVALKERGRLDIVKELKITLPNGMTGPVRPEQTKFQELPVKDQQKLTEAMSGNDKLIDTLVTELLGESSYQIAFYRRMENPAEKILARFCQKRRLVLDELYNILVRYDAAALADEFL